MYPLDHLDYCLDGTGRGELYSQWLTTLWELPRGGNSLHIWSLLVKFWKRGKLDLLVVEPPSANGDSRQFPEAVDCTSSRGTLRFLRRWILMTSARCIPAIVLLRLSTRALLIESRCLSQRNIEI